MPVPEGRIAKAIDKMIDKKYYLGDSTGELGWDCLNTIRSFYTDLGVTLPNEFEGVTWDSYVAKWDDDPDTARDVLVRFLRSLGRPIEVNYCLRGDLLIIETRAPKSLDKSVIQKAIDKLAKKFPKMVKEARKILEGKKLLVFPAIYVGGSKIFMVVTTNKDDRGPRILPLKFFKKYVKDVRRLI